MACASHRSLRDKKQKDLLIGPLLSGPSSIQRLAMKEKEWSGKEASAEENHRQVG